MNQRTQTGVGLIEVLIALVVTAVGLLGVAKMQALAIASTNTTSARSLIALQAQSLAAAMHANEQYWGNATSLTVTVTGSGITSTTDSSLSTQGSTACVDATCTAAVMASADLTNYGSMMASLVPSGSTTVTCTSTPVTCQVLVSWTEVPLGLNTGSNATTTSQAMDYSLLVQP